MKPRLHNGLTIADQIRAAASRLQGAGLPPTDAAFDAELLARSVLGWNRAELLTRADQPLSEDFALRYDALIARRELREPAAQVVGRREFWGRDFEVTRDVLVPRPDTELIIETALELYAGTAPSKLADVGTGSGCLAVTLAFEWPEAHVIATDVSDAALRVASRNAARYRLSTRIQFVRTDLLAGIAPGLELIVANPPYVRSGDRRALTPEVREYEPAEALFGGADGLDIVRALLDQVSGALAAGGRLVMEFGAGQDEDVAALIAARPSLALDEIRCDLRGIPRTAVVSRRR